VVSLSQFQTYGLLKMIPVELLVNRYSGLVGIERRRIYFGGHIFGILGQINGVDRICIKRTRGKTRP